MLPAYDLVITAMVIQVVFVGTIVGVVFHQVEAVFLAEVGNVTRQAVVLRLAQADERAVEVVEDDLPAHLADKRGRIRHVRTVPVALLPVHVGLRDVGAHDRRDAHVADIGGHHQGRLAAILVGNAVDRFAELLHGNVVGWVVVVAHKQHLIHHGSRQRDCHHACHQRFRTHMRQHRRNGEQQRADGHEQVAVIQDHGVHDHGCRPGNGEHAEVHHQRRSHRRNRIGNQPRVETLQAQMLHGVGGRARARSSVRALRLRRRDLLLARCATQPDAPCGPTRCPRDQERQHHRGGITGRPAPAPGGTAPQRPRAANDKGLVKNAYVASSI